MVSWYFPVVFFCQQLKHTSCAFLSFYVVVRSLKVAFSQIPIFVIFEKLSRYRSTLGHFADFLKFARLTGQKWAFYAPVAFMILFFAGMAMFVSVAALGKPRWAIPKILRDRV